MSPDMTASRGSPGSMSTDMRVPNTTEPNGVVTEGSPSAGSDCAATFRLSESIASVNTDTEQDANSNQVTPASTSHEQTRTSPDPVDVTPNDNADPRTSHVPEATEEGGQQVLPTEEAIDGAKDNPGPVMVDNANWPDWLKMSINKLNNVEVPDEFKAVIEKLVSLETLLGYPSGQVRVDTLTCRSLLIPSRAKACACRRLRDLKPSVAGSILDGGHG